MLDNTRADLSCGVDRPVYEAHLVEADVNKACVEVGGRLMRIGNGWQHLQVSPNAVSHEVDAAIVPVLLLHMLLPMLLHMLKSCRSLLDTTSWATGSSAVLQSWASPPSQQQVWVA